jgi:hypothetical protein
MPGNRGVSQVPEKHKRVYFTPRLRRSAAGGKISITRQVLSAQTDCWAQVFILWFRWIQESAYVKQALRFMMPR